MVGVDVDLLVAACGHHGLVLRVHCLVAEAAEIARRDVVTSRALDRLGHGGDGLRRQTPKCGLDRLGGEHAP